MAAPKSAFSGRRAKPPAPVAPETKTHIGGGALVPDLGAARERAGTLVQYRYWVGVLPDCPVESIDLCGINFPKVNENLIDDPMRTGIMKRVPVIGSIVWLTADKIRKMRDRLPRTVIRFLDEPEVVDEPGTGKNVGDVHRRARRGHLITIPTAAEVAERKKHGRSTRQYVPGPHDAPAANYMFAVLCADQRNGSRDETYPDVLADTGLSWPAELELDELLN